MRRTALVFLLAGCAEAPADSGSDADSVATDTDSVATDTDSAGTDTDSAGTDTDDTVMDTDDTDSAGPDTDDPPPPPDATFTRVRNEVINVSCAQSGCHGNARRPPAGLRLGDGTADHAALVGASSTQALPQVRVVAGDPDASYLVRKIEDAVGIQGTAMPPGNPLSADQVQLVRDWIAAGALND